ncbi:MAG: DUF1614 domain-containing protein [Limnochordia bacterium]|nr:DUF1614 domain-containing protein [Limnochordia bacterium]
MQPLPSSVTMLAVITVLVFLGLGQRVLDNMRLTDRAAIAILLLMILGHFLPTLSLGPYLAVNLGGFVPIGVVIYLLWTTSKAEQKRVGIVSFLTAFLIFLSDKLLPLQPGLLDPLFSGGILAGLVAAFLGRSRRGAFVAGILGVFVVDLVAVMQLWFQGVEQQITVGGGGLFSSMVISAFLAVVITEIVGEIREKIKLGGDGAA